MKKLKATIRALLTIDQVIDNGVKLADKIAKTNAKMADRNMSFRFRLGAVLACDNRPGQLWAV